MKRRRYRWIACLSLVTILLVASAGYCLFPRYQLEPWQHLALVEQIEHAGADETSIQPLGWSLAILGRDDEVREMNFHPQFDLPRSTVAIEDLELTVVPWRSGIKEIAANHRIVMIMESHFFSKHREFVGATLRTFKDAGFTHYAAEAISASDVFLAQRRYPTSGTGVYTSDPQFGKLLRCAFNLDFTVLGYDSSATTHDEREEIAATRLAKLLQDDANVKLLVHAGHAHVLKHEVEDGRRWLAALLWEKTGIEPFTIWQWSSQHDAHDYEKVIGELKARGISIDEPVLLMPPPAFDCGLQDSPYRQASVDAIVLHQPDHSVAPAKRTVLFPDDVQQLAGRWTANEWPVVISAYNKDEPSNAIPLDQVMLRQGEADFVLWIPTVAEYEIRVFNDGGLIDVRIDPQADFLSVGL